jgi:hypothetical protein
MFVAYTHARAHTHTHTHTHAHDDETAMMPLQNVQGTPDGSSFSFVFEPGCCTHMKKALWKAHFSRSHHARMQELTREGSGYFGPGSTRSSKSESGGGPMQVRAHTELLIMGRMCRSQRKTQWV